MPNVSGGLVISTVEQRTDWGIDYNRTLAQTAERLGFEYALTQTRYQASYGASEQHEATSFSLAAVNAAHVPVRYDHARFAASRTDSPPPRW